MFEKTGIFVKLCLKSTYSSLSSFYLYSLLCTQEVPSLDFDQARGSIDWGFSWFPSVIPINIKTIPLILPCSWFLQSCQQSFESCPTCNLDKPLKSVNKYANTFFYYVPYSTHKSVVQNILTTNNFTVILLCIFIVTYSQTWREFKGRGRK